eukprot:Skav209887  [mRNA]  locus=scaffold2642:242637:247068:- [translate_table: standard]
MLVSFAHEQPSYGEVIGQKQVMSGVNDDHHAAGESVDFYDQDGRTPLVTAAESNLPAVALMLLDAGADMDRATEDGRTPLCLGGGQGGAKGGEGWQRQGYIAAYDGNAAVVQHLLRFGASSDKATEDGRTPLIIAAGTCNRLPSGRRSVFPWIPRAPPVPPVPPVLPRQGPPGHRPQSAGGRGRRAKGRPLRAQRALQRGDEWETRRKQHVARGEVAGEATAMVEG